jgi:hypothetical protein
MLRIDGLLLDDVGEYEPELEVGDYQEGDPVEVGDFWGTMQHALSVGGTVLTNRYLTKSKGTGIIGRLETMPSAMPAPLAIPGAPIVSTSEAAGKRSQLLLVGAVILGAVLMLRR